MKVKSLCSKTEQSAGIIELIGLVACMDCGHCGYLIHRPVPGRPNNLICTHCESVNWKNLVAMHR